MRRMTSRALSGLVILGVWAGCASFQSQVQSVRTGEPAAVTRKETKERPLQLVVSLTDGSRLVGGTTLTGLPLRSEALGKVEVQLQKVRLIQFSKDHESVTVSLENGDTLKGGISTVSLVLQTLVGKFTVPPESGVADQGSNRVVFICRGVGALLPLRYG